MLLPIDRQHRCQRRDIGRWQGGLSGNLICTCKLDKDLGELSPIFSSIPTSLVTVCVRMTTLLMVDSQVAYLVQFSTAKPFTRSKSFTLLVTTMAPIARACAAIMRSAAPSWAPRFFRSARISA